MPTIAVVGTGKLGGPRVPRLIVVAVTSVAALALLGCGSPVAPTPDDSRSGPADTPAPASPSASVPAPSSAGDGTDPDAVAGSVVRFTAGDTSVDVTIRADNATTRDFLAMLPLTLSFEEFSGREKIAYLPRGLDTSGTPGSDPEDGDLIYFAPWGNLGFYYDASGMGHDDRVIRLGTFSATAQELVALENGDVVVERVR